MQAEWSSELLAVKKEFKHCFEGPRQTLEYSIETDQLTKL